MTIDESLTVAAKLIQEADAILIHAGAGMGVDSGLPDFRSENGFWKAYPMLEKHAIGFTEIASPNYFFTNPELAWAFYGHRLNMYRAVNPHAGFKMLLDICKKKKGGYFVFTSNVDGHFQKAGFAEDRIEECHGSINHLQCSKRCKNVIWGANGTDVQVDENLFQALKPLPHCPKCGGIARPNILMFGDAYWIADRSDSQRQNLKKWVEKIRAKKYKCVILEFGAGTDIATVRYESEYMSEQYSMPLIRINPRDCLVNNGNISIPLSALAFMNAII